MLHEKLIQYLECNWFSLNILKRKERKLFTICQKNSTPNKSNVFEFRYEIEGILFVYGIEYNKTKHITIIF